MGKLNAVFLTIAAVLATMAATPVAAQAPAAPVGLIREFAVLCMGTDGDAEQVRQRALATGYVAIPLGELPEDMDIEDGKAFLKGGVPTMTLILGTSRQRFDGGPLIMEFCGVKASSEPFDDVAQGAEAFFGHDPIHEGAGQRMFAWAAEPTGRRAFETLTPAQLRRFSRDGTLRLALVGRDGVGSWVGLVRPETR